MPTPPLSRELAAEAVAWMNSGLTRGLSQNAVARELKIPQGTFKARLDRARQLYGLEPNEPAKPVIREAPIAKPVVRVKAVSQPADAPIYRVLAWGDAHDGPHLADKSRFKWMARHAAEVKPDYLVQIGDFATFDSLSRHAQPGTIEQKLRPSYVRDMESFEEALKAIHDVIGTDMQMHVTLGNHEGRVKRFESGAAEIEGALWFPLMELFARYGWRTHDEGEFLFIGGCGFVHAPRTLMGREYGGKTMNAIANDAMFSIVMGHSHRMQFLHVPKIGPMAGIDLVNLGTTMPTGHVEHYARVATTGWTYGTVELTIQGGRVIGHSFTSMDDLRDRFGR